MDFRASTQKEAETKAQELANSNSEILNVIHTYGYGYEIVAKSFQMDRAYYHNTDGRKMFFEHISVITPNQR